MRRKNRRKKRDSKRSADVSESDASSPSDASIIDDETVGIVKQHAALADHGRKHRHSKAAPDGTDKIGRKRKRAKRAREDNTDTGSERGADAGPSRVKRKRSHGTHASASSSEFSGSETDSSSTSRRHGSSADEIASHLERRNSHNAIKLRRHRQGAERSTRKSLGPASEKREPKNTGNDCDGDGKRRRKRRNVEGGSASGSSSYSSSYSSGNPNRSRSRHRKAGRSMRAKKSAHFKEGSERQEIKSRHSTRDIPGSPGGTGTLLGQNQHFRKSHAGVRAHPRLGTEGDDAAFVSDAGDGISRRSAPHMGGEPPRAIRIDDRWDHREAGCRAATRLITATEASLEGIVRLIPTAIRCQATTRLTRRKANSPHGVTSSHYGHSADHTSHEMHPTHAALPDAHNIVDTHGNYRRGHSNVHPLNNVPTSKKRRWDAAQRIRDSDRDPAAPGYAAPGIGVSHARSSIPSALASASGHGAPGSSGSSSLTRKAIRTASILRHAVQTWAAAVLGADTSQPTRTPKQASRLHSHTTTRSYATQRQ